MWKTKLCLNVLDSKEGRHENDAYGEMSYERYIATAYMRACRVATLMSAALNESDGAVI